MRRAEERCKEAERATKLGDAEVADVLWQARCALAEAPMDLVRAFPGVQCCSPGQVQSERRSHPLRKGANGGLLGSVFADNSGKTWCVEELATDEAGCQVGIYAYDTARWASAALRLDERCTFFGQEVLSRRLSDSRRRRPARWRTSGAAAALRRGHSTSGCGGRVEAHGRPTR